MTPGTILHDQKFTFSDGTQGNKLLVLLTPQVDGFFYIAAKTTSKEKHKGKNAGCQHEDKHPNFYIPQGTSSFPSNTWISLNEFYELKSVDLLQRRFSGEIKTIDSLDNDTIKKLLECVLKSEDITPHQETAIQNALDQLKSSPTEQINQ